jgi:hypothetical protein
LVGGVDSEGYLALHDLVDGDAKRVGRAHFDQRGGTALQLAGSFGDGTGKGILAAGNSAFSVRKCYQVASRVSLFRQIVPTQVADTSCVFAGAAHPALAQCEERRAARTRCESALKMAITV